MRASFIQFKSADGQKVEGAAIATAEDGSDLPEGTWNVQYSDGRKATMMQEEMPQHWQDQLRNWGAFFRRYAKRRGFK